MRKWNKLLALLLAMVMALGMTVTAFAEGEDATEDAVEYNGTIVILHTNDVHGAIDGYAKVAALKAQYEDSLKQASAEGAQIINDAKAKAKAESNTILEHANAAAAELMETTKRSAQREKEKILKEVEPQVSYLAVAAAAKIVGEECSEEKNKALYDQFLIKAGDVSGTEE